MNDAVLENTIPYHIFVSFKKKNRVFQPFRSTALVLPQNKFLPALKTKCFRRTSRFNCICTRAHLPEVLVTPSLRSKRWHLLDSSQAFVWSPPGAVVDME